MREAPVAELKLVAVEAVGEDSVVAGVDSASEAESVMKARA